MIHGSDVGAPGGRVGFGRALALEHNGGLGLNFPHDITAKYARVVCVYARDAVSESVAVDLFHGSWL